MVAHTHPDALPSPSARGEGGRRAGRSMSAGGGALGYLGGAHPTVNLMHVATKVAPALVYLLCASGDRDARAARCASDVGRGRGARARAAGRCRALVREGSTRDAATTERTRRRRRRGPDARACPPRQAGW